MFNGAILRSRINSLPKEEQEQAEADALRSTMTILKLHVALLVLLGGLWAANALGLI